MQLMQTLPTEQDLLNLAAKMAQAIQTGMIIYLHGPLGAGKTTFTRGFLRGLGFTDKVKSPTYTLVEPYEMADHTLFHFDFYRLQTANELEHIGIQDYFTPTSICIVEWAEKGAPLLPTPDVECYLDFAGTGRKMQIAARTERGRQLLKAME